MRPGQKRKLYLNWMMRTKDIANEREKAKFKRRKNSRQKNRTGYDKVVT